MTHAATGASQRTETPAATQEAVTQAMQGLRGSARLGWLFCSPQHDLKTVMAGARALAPECEFFGAHTAGEFTERGASRGSVVAFLLASDSLVVASAAATGLSQDVDRAVGQLAAPFAELVARAATQGLGLSTSVLLLDALTGVGEQVVQGLRSRTRLFQQIVGGAAGDEGQFKATPVAGAGQCGVDTAVVAHVFDQRPWGVGVDHGLRAATPRMTVTSGSGSIIAKLDGRPAYDVYREYAASRGVDLTPANSGSFFIANELGVYFLDDIHHARAPVGVGPQGELHLIASISQGASVCILDGDPDSMVAACARAAKQARANVGAGPVAGVLVFDCICRGMILGREFQREIDAVRDVFPDVPVAGFLTYGEIARFRGRSEGWHNTTSVVVAIPA